MRSGVIISLLILALSGYGLYRYWSQPAQPFTASLMKVDSTRVTSLVIRLPGNNTEITLLREPEGWIASNGQVNIKASATMVHTLLNELSEVPIQEMVATDQKFWKVYGVDNKQGVRVQLYQNKKLLEDFIVGNLDTDPISQAPISYLRLTKGPEIYAVTSKLATDFNQDFNAFRNRIILQLAPNTSITALEIQTLDSTLQCTPTPEGWKMGMIVLDSLSMLRYLNQLHSIAGEIFADDFDEVQGSKYVYQTLKITNSANIEPFVITCYRDTTRKLPFIIQSNQNKEAFFASDSLGVYHKIFGFLNRSYKN